MSNEVLRAADLLCEAAATRQTCPPVREIGIADVDQAYAVQELVAGRRQAGGARPIGSKIGLTSPSVQRQFGVFEPDFGVLFADMSVDPGASVGLTRFMQPRVEAEIAFVMARGLDDPNATTASVLAATEFVVPAIEIVDSRIAGWDISIVDTVADNASAGGFVLGTVATAIDRLDLGAVGMSLDRDGEQVSTGAGWACLGSPVVAVAWLARQLARRGQPISAGDVVLSGALGPMIPVEQPGSFSAKFDAAHGSLGSVEVVFTA